MPLATLYRAPTISQLAGIFGAIGSEEPWSSSVEMQPGDSRLPLFLVHGAGGNVLLYRDLVRHLGPDQPAYGLQSRGLDGQQEILTTIRQMASHYLKEVRTIQPRGPYLLGGYCMGGSVALEMAQLLHRSGEHVALLFLLETYNFSKIGEQSLFDRAHYNLQRLKYHWLNYALLGQNGKSDFMKEKINIAISRKAVWLGTLESMLGRRGFPNSNQARNLADIWRANDNAAMTYSPQTYGGKIIQFKAFKEYAVHSRPEVGWESLARGGLEIHRLPVYPAGMLVEPYVRELAARLKKYIAEATN